MKETTTKKPTKTEIDRATRLIKREMKKNGPDAIRDIPPVAIKADFSQFDASDMLSKNIYVSPVVNPLFDAVMIVLGFSRRSNRSYTIGAGEDLSKKIIISALAATPPSAAYARAGAERVSQSGISEFRIENHAFDVLSELSRAPAGEGLSVQEVSAALGKSALYGSSYYSFVEDDQRVFGHSIVSFSSNGSSINASVGTTWEGYRGGRGLCFWENAPDLHLLPIGSVKDPVAVSPMYASAIIDTATDWGFPVIVEGDQSEISNAISDCVFIEPIPGSPGEARVASNEAVIKSHGLSIEDDDFYRLGTSQFFEKEMTAAEASDFHRNSKKKIKVSIDSRVEDVVSMTSASPTGKRDGLRPYQDEAVSLHLATDFGYVNASAPGLGKTVMALTALREKSSDDYRGLIVCPASIRSQWISEAGRFFPEARVATFKSGDVDPEVGKFLKKKGPALIVLSYDSMRVGSDYLAQFSWDDLVCDEAAILGNHTTARSRALWQLRDSAKVAVALTGTPINKSLDDLGHIVSWVRDDREAFHGLKLSRRFDMALDEDIDLLWRSLGPTVFRRDRSEIADQLPKIDTEVIRIDPEPEELELANGARDQLRKIYKTLEEKLSVAESIKPDDPALKEARDDMRQIRGAVLGGTTLARMAASDPESLKNSSSGTAGIALLKSAGLLEPALKKGGTKRKLITGLVSDLSERGDSVLIFTDFATVAKNLKSSLEDKGVRVGTFTGKDTAKRREEAVDLFQDGKLDCLILTGAGREGLNLQAANVLIHYDLPWVPSQVIQRVGRASRFGSQNGQLSVVVPIIKGTIEEKVASILVPRAVEAMRALDGNRSSDASETEIGIAISGLDEAVPTDMRENNSLFDMAAEIFTKDE